MAAPSSARRRATGEDARVEALVGLEVTADAGPVDRAEERAVGADEVHGRALGPVGQHRERVAEHAQDELLALLRVERLAKPGLAAGKRAHGHDDVQRAEGGIGARRPVLLARHGPNGSRGDLR